MSALDEAGQASAAFQIALTRMGVSTIAEALSLWSKVNPTEIDATAGDWLDDAIQMILSRRGRSRELAVAYYRLVRALRTGKTVPSPNDPTPSHVTMKQLRKEFAELVEDAKGRPRVSVAAASTSKDRDPDKNAEPSSESGPRDVAQELDELDDEPDYTPGRSGDDVEVEIEFEFSKGSDAAKELAELRRRIAEEDRAAEEEARLVLNALGPLNLKAKLTGADDPKAEATHSEILAAKLTAGARQASAAERVVMNAGRGEVFARAERDKRSLGFIRMSRSGTPCGWCAMLLSRGAVYFSSASAGQTAEGDLYHDNCHCIAVPVFSPREFADSPAYALNRQYHGEWPKVTKGLSGKAAVTAWRRHVREQQREARRLART